MGRLAVGSTPRLIIFDCDGTLVDSQHMIVSAMTTALAQNGISPLPRGRVLDG
ncbi:MAG: HAD hydrolase-like protein, partial [Hyphomicrobiaceae bacterium]